MTNKNLGSYDARPLSKAPRGQSKGAANFTPGPWHCTTEHDKGACVYVYAVDGALYERGEIAVCYAQDGLDIARANASLTAAAPDLYEALTDALVTIKALHGPVAWSIYWTKAPEMKRYRAALAKARGDVEPKCVAPNANSSDIGATNETQ